MAKAQIYLGLNQSHQALEIFTKYKEYEYLKWFCIAGELSIYMLEDNLTKFQEVIRNQMRSGNPLPDIVLNVITLDDTEISHQIVLQQIQNTGFFGDYVERLVDIALFTGRFRFAIALSRLYHQKKPKPYCVQLKIAESIAHLLLDRKNVFTKMYMELLSICSIGPDNFDWSRTPYIIPKRVALFYEVKAYSSIIPAFYYSLKVLSEENVGVLECKDGQVKIRDVDLDVFHPEIWDEHDKNFKVFYSIVKVKEHGKEVEKVFFIEPYFEQDNIDLTPQKSIQECLEEILK